MGLGDPSNGQTYHLWADGYEPPVLVPEENSVGFTASIVEQDGKTILEYTRSLESCVHRGSTNVRNEEQFVVWAFGDIVGDGWALNSRGEFDFSLKHSGDKTTHSYFLQNLVNPVLDFQPPALGGEENVKKLEIRMPWHEVSVSNDSF